MHRIMFRRFGSLLGRCNRFDESPLLFWYTYLAMRRKVDSLQSMRWALLRSVSIE